MLKIFITIFQHPAHPVHIYNATIKLREMPLNIREYISCILLLYVFFPLSIKTILALIVYTY